MGEKNLIQWYWVGCSFLLSCESATLRLSTSMLLYEVDETNEDKLLVCALGSISEQFPWEDPARLPRTFRDSQDYQLGEAWFAASQKRIGILLSRGGGVLEAQCFFFSGVYLAHSFRPFAAWPLFLQAIACCQVFQCFSRESVEPSFPLHTFGEDGAGWRSEESMYWTCFKSELYVKCLLQFSVDIYMVNCL
jgi:hypothetical protein